MTENERILRKELLRLDTENKELKRRLQIANEKNYKLYRDNLDLSYYIRQMESIGRDIDYGY